MSYVHETLGIPWKAVRLIDALRRCLGTPHHEYGSDPFDWFLALLRSSDEPLVVWNLGGAADVVHWPTAVQHALACVRTLDTRTTGIPDAKWPVTPIVYVVSDRSSDVLRGLEHRLGARTA